jgi:hypothetical protein
MLSRKIMNTSSAPTQPRYKGATTQSLKTLKLYGLNHYYRIYRFSATRGLLGKDISIRTASIVPGKASEHKLDHVLGVESDLNIN